MKKRDWLNRLNLYMKNQNIMKIDEDHIHVTYTETFDSTKKFHVWNYKVMSFILYYFNLKKMKRMLMAMEYHILNKEESI